VVGGKKDKGGGGSSTGRGLFSRCVAEGKKSLLRKKAEGSSPLFALVPSSIERGGKKILGEGKEKERVPICAVSSSVGLEAREGGGGTARGKKRKGRRSQSGT